MSDKSILSGLEDALENGEFNSEVANKFNKINEAVDEKMKNSSMGEIQKSVDKRIEGNLKTVDEKKIGVDDYENYKKMSGIRLEENRLSIIASLCNYDDAIINRMKELKSFIVTVELEFESDLEANNGIFDKIKYLNDKYMLNK